MNPKPIRSLMIAISLLLGAVLLSHDARACDVPVFRYALERWPADALELVVFHRGSLTVEQASLVDALTRRVSPDMSAIASPVAAAAGDKSSSAAPLNLTIRTVDLATSDSANADPNSPDRILWQSQANAPLPWMTLSYAAGGNRHGVAWSASLAKENVAALIDSPARQQIAQRLLSGHSVVWVMLDSGNSDADRAAHERLTAILKTHERDWSRAATSQPAGDAAEPGPPALPIRFSVLRIAHDDGHEAALRAMLRHCEDELPTDQPIVFPVFGQGRALYGIVGRGITERNVAEAIGFLTGPCSCEVKAQNPGVDILLAADWSVLTGPRFVDDAPPDLTSLSAIAEQAAAPNVDVLSSSNSTTQPAAITTDTASRALQGQLSASTPLNKTAAPAPAQTNRLPTIIGVIVFLIAVTVGAASVVLHRKTQRANPA